MDFCPNFRKVAVKPSVTGKEINLVHLRCKKWSCEFCAEKNRLVWRAHLLDALNKKVDGCEWCFITLTAHKNAQTPQNSIKNLKGAWDKLYHRIRRKWALQDVEYAMLYEPNQKGAYHIHAIINLGVDGDNVFDVEHEEWRHQGLTSWLKDNAAACGAGYIAHGVKIDAPNPGLVVAYITKYMTKENTGWADYPKYCHRIAVTRGIGSPKFEAKEKGWVSTTMVHASEIANGVTIVDLNTRERIDLEWMQRRNVAAYPEGAYFEWRAWLEARKRGE